MPTDSKPVRPYKAALFLVAAALAGALSFGPLYTLVRTGRPADYYTHIPLIPVVSAFVLFKRRKRLFRDGSNSPLLGIVALALSAGLLVADILMSPGLISHAELRVAGSILLLCGVFLALFGKRAFRRALFPFLFLVFLIPLPLAWMDHVVSTLVKGSIGFTHLLLRAFRVPFFQDGSVFYLPGFDIEVAQECSGIRSSLALLITSVLAAQIFLDRPWKKIALAVAVFPVTILKNAVRIVTLYLLSYFIDIRIIEGGFLHRSGGFVFFGLGLVILAFILWILKSPREAWLKVKERAEYSLNNGLTND